MLSRLLHTPTLMLLRRIALLYLVLMLCRVVFYIYNASLLGSLAWGEAWQLLCGALKFDTVSVGYADGLFVLLSLLPFHFTERRWYRRLLYGYYVVVNALLMVMINLADCVYFRYTQKRFTADEIFFSDNSNSLQLVGKFVAENWYLGIVAAALIGLLAWGYRYRVREESMLRDGVVYYLSSTILFALAAALCIAGIRGGMTRMTRPITLYNATLYTPDSGKANLILSNPFCILRTIGSEGSINYTKYFSEEELSRYFDPVHRPKEQFAADSTMLGLASQRTPVDSTAANLAGRNVVIFSLESMSAEHSAHLKPELYADHVSSEKFAPETIDYPGNMHIMGFIYTPDGALRGEVGEVTQQLDIMPTLLGVLGNREPYFAFGRDVLNEPNRPRWSVSYDGRFRALTDEAILCFDNQTTEIIPRKEATSADSERLLQRFQAMVQQYYSHAESKNYLPND